MGVFELISRLNGGPLDMFQVGSVKIPPTTWPTVDTMEIPDLFRYLNYGVRIDTFEVGSVKIEPTTWPMKKKDDQGHRVIENKVDQEPAIVTVLEKKKKKEVKKDICSQLDEFSSFVQQEILGLDHNTTTKKLQDDDLKCQHKKKKTTTNRVRDRVLQEEIKICSTLKEEDRVREKRLIVNIAKKELGDQVHGKRSRITLKKEEDSLIVMEVELDGSRKKLHEEYDQKIENARKKRRIDQVIESEKKPCKQAKKAPVKKKHQHPLFKQRRESSSG